MNKYIILHNRHDEKSRKFVDAISLFSIDRFCVLDWYGNQKERWVRSCVCHFMQPYLGPPPSAFPVIVTRNSNGIWGAIQNADDPDERHNLSKYFFEAAHGACLGGKWIEGIPDSIRGIRQYDPKLAQVIESVYRKHVRIEKSVFGKILPS
jgi:hypothetical protein